MTGHDQVIYLKFARNVGASKVVEALTALDGVDKAILKEFSTLMLNTIGKEIKKVSRGEGCMMTLTCPDMKLLGKQHICDLTGAVMADSYHCQDETIALGWSASDGALWIEVRGTKTGSFKNAELANGIFEIYLGAKVGLNDDTTACEILRA